VPPQSKQKASTPSNRSLWLWVIVGVAILILYLVLH
jgi:hypothetical protein